MERRIGFGSNLSMRISKERLDLRKNRSKHLWGESSGIRVVTAWMIAIDDHPIANPMHRAGAERAAINAPIQGTSADLIKRAMNRMDAALADAGLHDVTMLLQVHDELLFEVSEADAPRLIPIAKEVMETASHPAVMLNVHLAVEAGQGKTWAAAH